MRSPLGTYNGNRSVVRSAASSSLPSLSEALRGKRKKKNIAKTHAKENQEAFLNENTSKTPLISNRGGIHDLGLPPRPRRSTHLQRLEKAVANTKREQHRRSMESAKRTTESEEQDRTKKRNNVAAEYLHADRKKKEDIRTGQKDASFVLVPQLAQLSHTSESDHGPGAEELMDCASDEESLGISIASSTSSTATDNVELSKEWVLVPPTKPQATTIVVEQEEEPRGSQRLSFPMTTRTELYKQSIKSPPVVSHLDQATPVAQKAKSIIVTKGMMARARQSKADNGEVIAAMLASGPPYQGSHNRKSSLDEFLVGATVGGVALERSPSLDASEVTMLTFESTFDWERRTSNQQESHRRRNVDDAKKAVRERVLVPSAPRDNSRLGREPAPRDNSRLGPPSAPRDDIRLGPRAVDEGRDERNFVTTQNEENPKPNYRRGETHRAAKVREPDEGVDEGNQVIYIEHNGVMIPHPPLPPGWIIRMSQSKQRPFYCHPDFGSTWHCPVVLPKDTVASSPWDATRSNEQVIPPQYQLHSVMGQNCRDTTYQDTSESEMSHTRKNLEYSEHHRPVGREGPFLTNKNDAYAKGLADILAESEEIECEAGSTSDPSLSSRYQLELGKQMELSPSTELRQFITTVHLRSNDSGVGTIATCDEEILSHSLASSKRQSPCLHRRDGYASDNVVMPATPHNKSSLDSGEGSSAQVGFDVVEDDESSIENVENIVRGDCIGFDEDIPVGADYAQKGCVPKIEDVAMNQNFDDRSVDNVESPVHGTDPYVGDEVSETSTEDFEQAVASAVFARNHGDIVLSPQVQQLSHTPSNTKKRNSFSPIESLHETSHRDDDGDHVTESAFASSPIGAISWDGTGSPKRRCVSQRVSHPPHPLCSLLNLESLMLAARSTKRPNTMSLVQGKYHNRGSQETSTRLIF